MKDITMLKYQVRNSSLRPPSSYLTPSSSSSHDTTLTSRSSSMVSLNSVDSSGSTEGDWGALRVYTHNIKECTDYKTIRVSTQTTAASVTDTVLSKIKLSCRDANLFELWMELTTKVEGQAVRTILKLSKEARPLELQRCHPVNMSRFILHMNSPGVFVRVYDHNISPQSNYKGLLLSPVTSCQEVVRLLLSMNRKEFEPNYGMFLTAPEGEAQIPDEVSLVAIYNRCRPEHKIVIRQVDSL